MSFLPDELADLGTFAHKLADAARAETLTRFRQGVSIVNKLEQSASNEFDPVTDADREGERVVRALIETVFPDHGVLGEEFEERKGASPWRWVLDPVDGTRAFMCGTPTWTTLIGLEYEDEPVLGLIDQPFTDERWIGFGGGVEYRRAGETRPAQTSGLGDLSQARISTTDPLEAGYFTQDEAAAYARIAAASCVARFSMDAYAYALLALGEIDIVLETCLKHHDYAALIPIVEGAGGVVTNWRGEKPGADDRGEIIAAATPKLHEAALALIAG
ncbi:inositol monophosphatase family protein [Hyphococcus sp.]|uniref:inositol monophosphatase family protein n=1 Tax=Hyphococcus sp. TaxID=2038636 RepID=UPI003CCB7E58